MYKLYVIFLFLNCFCLLIAPYFRKNISPSIEKYWTLYGKAPEIIGHRGASGLRPAHTLASYQLAIEQGADIIEPDLVMTKDGVLICRHEPMLSLSTNVAKVHEFSKRKKWKKVSGVSYHDWFVEDFTLKEIKKLRASQHSKSRSQEYNGKFSIATFDEVIELVKNKSTELGKTIKIYPELKHPTFHETNQLSMTENFLETLDREGWNHEDSPVYVQCTEVTTLQYIHSVSTVKLIQLILASGVDKEGRLLMKGYYGKPYDFTLANDSRAFKDLVTDEGLDLIKSYAIGIGVWTPYIIPYTYLDLNHDNKPDDLNGDGLIDNRDRIALPSTDLINRAHKRELLVHVYTLKDEPSSLLSDYNGDPMKEYEALYKLGVDAIFSDFPSTAIMAKANCFQKTY